MLPCVPNYSFLGRIKHAACPLSHLLSLRQPLFGKLFDRARRVGNSSRLNFIFSNPRLYFVFFSPPIHYVTPIFLYDVFEHFLQLFSPFLRVLVIRVVLILITVSKSSLRFLAIQEVLVSLLEIACCKYTPALPQNCRFVVRKDRDSVVIHFTKITRQGSSSVNMGLTKSRVFHSVIQSVPRTTPAAHYSKQTKFSI